MRNLSINGREQVELSGISADRCVSGWRRLESRWMWKSAGGGEEEQGLMGKTEGIWWVDGERLKVGDAGL